MDDDDIEDDDLEEYDEDPEDCELPLGSPDKSWFPYDGHPMVPCTMPGDQNDPRPASVKPNVPFNYSADPSACYIVHVVPAVDRYLHLAMVDPRDGICRCACGAVLQRFHPDKLPESILEWYAEELGMRPDPRTIKYALVVSHRPPIARMEVPQALPVQVV